MSKVAVVYWSSTGNTEAMANAVAEGAACFEFPQASDLPDSSNHYGAGSGGNRHGGS